MLRVFANRLPQLIIVVLGCSLLTFALVNLLPGDVVSSILGEDYTEAGAAQLREELNLDQPPLLRYLTWLGDSLTGSFGVSLIPPHYSAAQLIARSLLPTVELVIFGQIFALLIGVFTAVLSVSTRSRIVDRAVSAFALMADSIPGFVLGLLLLIPLAVHFKLVSPLGWASPFTEGWAANLGHIMFPAFVLGLFAFPMFMRVFRAELVNQLDNEDYVVLARLKGLRTRRVIFSHAVRNSSFGILTILGINVARLIGGVVVIEQIFSIPGMGTLIKTSVVQHDAPLVLASVSIVAVFVVVANLLVDVTYAALDPRVRSTA